MFDVEKIKRKTLLKYPFFGSLVAGCRIIQTEKMTTACTDGKNIFVNPNFMETLDEAGQEFVLAHEILHIASDHIRRSDGKVKKLWNIATDAVINQMLRRDGGIIPAGGVDMPEALNKKAETIYDKLVKEAEEKQQAKEQGESGQQQQNGGGQGSSQGQASGGESSQEEQGQGQGQGQSGSGESSEKDSPSSDGADGSDQGQSDSQESGAESGQGEGSGNSSQGGENSDGGSQGGDSRSGSGDEEGGDNVESEDGNAGHDSHDLWEEVVKNYKEGKGLKSDFEKELQGEESEEEKKKDEERQKKIEEEASEGEDKLFEKNDKQVQENLEKMIEKLNKKSSSGLAGKGTSSRYKNFDNVGKAKPLINWKRLLRESAKINADWSYRDGEFENNVLNARLIKYAEPETEIMLDVSGSVSEDLLKNFLRECKNILQVSRIKVGQFNTRFIDFQEVRSEADIEKIRFNIDGGTDFNAAVDNFSPRAANKIIFTDGKASMPRENCRAIWVVFGGRKINPKGGRVIEISDEALAKLQAPKIKPFSR